MERVPSAVFNRWLFGDMPRFGWLLVIKGHYRIAVVDKMAPVIQTMIVGSKL